MRLITTLSTCAAIGALATIPAHAQSMSPPQSSAVRGDKSSKMSAPDSGEKHAMSKKGGAMMKDSAATSKSAMKPDRGMKSDTTTTSKSKGMMKSKPAHDSSMMKHDGMAKDSAMKKKPTA